MPCLSITSPPIIITSSFISRMITATHGTTGGMADEPMAMLNRAVSTITLSANGSTSLPKSVMRLYFRAMRPSSRSVRLAARKVTSAAYFCPLTNSTTYTGTSRSRIMVSTLGTFRFLRINSFAVKMISPLRYVQGYYSINPRTRATYARLKAAPFAAQTRLLAVHRAYLRLTFTMRALPARGSPNTSFPSRAQRVMRSVSASTASTSR